MNDTQQPKPGDDNSIIGKTIGQFSVLEEIGRGGMATVYRATQQSINRDVALKVLPRSFLHDPGFFERFEREVDVIAHLEHPHIVPIYDYGKADGMPYIAMRYLAGGSLHKLIRQETQDLRDLIRPVRQIAQALDHAHQQGIIHRDLKPGNILLDTSDNAYLSDFGIARVLDSDLTGSAIIGTPSYMSPEQANGEPLDGRSDVYALGMVVFELITGTEPFQAATPIAMLLKQINERVPSLTEYADDIPEDVDRVIAKATEKQPDNRYDTAVEFAAAFEDAVRDSGATFALRRAKRAEADTAAYNDTLSQSEDMPTVTPGPMSAPQLNRATVTPSPISTQERAAAMWNQTPASVEGPKTEFANPTPYPAATAAEKAKGRPQRRWGFGIAAVVAVVAVVGVVIANPFAGSYSLADAVPVFADDMQIVVDERYALGIPGDLTRLSPEAATWLNEDGSVSVALEIERANPEYGLMEAAINFAQNSTGDLIDAETLPNGNFRQSFRFNDGQTDVYYARFGDNIFVMSMYAADVVGNSYTTNFQNILSSLRVPPPTS
ncbi:MAG: serine/threonine-protein kinase [Chloroflexota bacterium]